MWQGYSHSHTASRSILNATLRNGRKVAKTRTSVWPCSERYRAGHRTATVYADTCGARFRRYMLAGSDDFTLRPHLITVAPRKELVGVEAACEQYESQSIYKESLSWHGLSQSSPLPPTQALLDERLPRGCLLNLLRPSNPTLVLLRRPLGMSSSTDGRVGTLTSTSVEEPAVEAASSVASLV